METKKNLKPCCPECRSTDLLVIGAVVMGTRGVKLEDSKSLLTRKDTRMSHEVLRCVTCNKETTLAKAKDAADMVTDAVYWETNQHGLPVPIKCAYCGNSKHFSRKLKQHVETTEFVEIEDGNIINTESSADAIPVDRVVEAYNCADCNKEIIINDAPYALVPSH